jgi:antiviral helicase SLH1
MWDPHIKAFLLLQAYMGDVELPISDYMSDQISVLDQTVRIIQAGIDVMTELNRFDGVRFLIQLLQCVKSACTPDAYPLAFLPGAPQQWSDKWEGKAPKDLVTLAELSLKHGRSTIDALLGVLGVKVGRRGEFVRAMNYLPVLDVKATGKEGEVGVNMTRRNALANPQGRIWAPRFGKPQTEGFFVVVFAHGSNEISALKRVGWNVTDKNGGSSGRAAKGGLTSSARIKLEPSSVERKVDLVVFSDSYLGMEWHIEGVVVPKSEPVVEPGQETIEVPIDEGLIKKAKLRETAGEK